MYGVPGVPLLGPSDGASMAFPLEQPKNLFRYGEQTIWSSQFYAAAAVANNTNRVFTTPLGQVGQGFANALSISETNLKEGGRIPSGVAYDVFGIAAQFLQDTNTDAAGTLSVPVNDTAIANSVTNLQNFINNCVLTWDFTQTQVDVAPAHLIGAGGGVFGAEAINSSGAEAGSGNLNNGNGALWLYRKHPVALPGNSTFAMLLRWGSRAAAVQTQPIVIRVILLGYYKNVIEIG
jgi:hypothetical protein